MRIKVHHRIASLIFMLWAFVFLLSTCETIHTAAACCDTINAIVYETQWWILSPFLDTVAKALNSSWKFKYINWLRKSNQNNCLRYKSQNETRRMNEMLLQRSLFFTNKREKEEIFIPPGISDSWAFTAMMTQSLTSCKFMEIYSIVRFCYRSHFASFHHPPRAVRKDEKWNEKSDRENLKKTIRIHHSFHSERKLSIYPLESSFTRSRSRILFDFWSQFNTFSNFLRCLLAIFINEKVRKRSRASIGCEATRG